MRQHDEDEKYAEGRGRDGEEVDRGEYADVIRKEGAPGLGRRRACPAWHQTRDLALGDPDAELDEEFGAIFDRVAKGAGMRVIKTAVRAPNMNPVGERFVGSLRREALDHVLLLDDWHLENVARQYVRYFNTRRDLIRALGSGSRMAR